jgi:hypothetical protein
MTEPIRTLAARFLALFRRGCLKETPYADRLTRLATF